MDAKLARAEAAVGRAEAAQHAAESAAVRARIDKIALASDSEIQPPQQSDQGGGDISTESSPNPAAVEPQVSQAVVPSLN